MNFAVADSFGIRHRGRSISALGVAALFGSDTEGGSDVRIRIGSDDQGRHTLEADHSKLQDDVGIECRNDLLELVENARTAYQRDHGMQQNNNVLFATANDLNQLLPFGRQVLNGPDYLHMEWDKVILQLSLARTDGPIYTSLSNVRYRAPTQPMDTNKQPRPVSKRPRNVTTPTEAICVKHPSQASLPYPYPQCDPQALEEYYTNQRNKEMDQLNAEAFSAYTRPDSPYTP